LFEQNTIAESRIYEEPSIVSAKTISIALISLIVVSSSNLSNAQDKSAKGAEAKAAKGAQRQTNRDARMAALFSLVHELDRARPITHESIKRVTKVELGYNCADHFRSIENPGCNPLVRFVHATGEGVVDLELKRPSGITMSDVKRAFGKWARIDKPGSLVVQPPARAYIYARPKGWITFECEKSKKQELLVVCLIDKGPD
jgi:hypothetical protein